MAERESLESLVRQAWDVGWNRADVAAFRNFYADGFVRHSFAGEADIDMVARHISEVHSAFPDFVLALDDLITEGERVAVRWTATASHTGDFMSIPPTYRHLEVQGMTFARFVDGKCVEEWATWSPGEMLRRLRITPIGEGDV